MAGFAAPGKAQGVVNYEDMPADILYLHNLDVGATLVSPTVAEVSFGRSKDRPYIASFFYQK